MRRYSLASKIRMVLQCFFVFPHCLFFLLSKNKAVIRKDIVRRALYRSYIDTEHIIVSLCLALLNEKEFRNQFYLRIGFARHFLNLLLPGISTMDLGHCRNIGGGLCIIHGFGLVINPDCVIGENCTVLHGVTLGYTDSGTPIIGNNVYIGCGASVIGGVLIGDNVRIGAGTIVCKDVPDNATVVGASMRIIQK